MPIQFDPLLIGALAEAIADRWSRARVRSLELDRSRRLARLVFADASQLLFALHPSAGYVLEWPSDDPSPDPGENGFDRVALKGLALGPVVAPPDERLLRLDCLAPDGTVGRRIVVELQTNQWNLLDTTPLGDPPTIAEVEGAEWRIERALWPRDSGGRALRGGRRYRAPEAPERRASDTASEEDFAGSDDDPNPVRRRLLRTLEGVSAVNVDWILEAPDVGSALRRYRDLIQRPQGAWLLPRSTSHQPYIHPLGHETASRASDPLQAMKRCVELDGGAERLFALRGPRGRGADAERSRGGQSDAAAPDRLAHALQRRRSRARRRRAALERELEGVGDAAELRLKGQLLIAHKTAASRGATRVELPDFEGRLHEVELDEKLSALENAERYFERAKRVDRARARLPEEIAKARTEVRRLDDGLRSLEENGPNDTLWALAGIEPVVLRGRRKDTTRRLPYRRLRSSGGLEIRVGRGAKDNDRLTFHHSSPNDVWLHARQTSGAHVILRWSESDQNPPARDLHEAAIAAAVGSGARHSGTVPVDWTRRKYVRKPRKAPPGTVSVERTKTVFVVPDRELIERLRVEE